MKRLFFSLLVFFSLSAVAQSDSTIVLFETTKGNIRFMLYDDTPLHRAAMLKHVEEGFYDGTLFHRVIKDFMIQGGDPKSKDAQPGWQLGEGNDQTMEEIPAEIIYPKYRHKRGALAAAREGDDKNPEWKSSNCQFYFVWGKYTSDDEMMDFYFRNERVFGQLSEQRWDEISRYYQRNPGAPWLDGSYTVFGEIVEGLEVVGEIQKMKCDRNDRPLEDVRIIKATVLKKAPF